ncbi:MAG: hypothetical protein C0392_04635 [Syntrophus sp. (in: bacteria)]|nr:hypothetical protein [Syntrophus sp. (in: bacteria)]
MDFDINKTLEDMLAAATKVFTGKWPEIEGIVKTIMQNEKETLLMIAEARLNGEIDDDEMKGRLKQEKKVFKAGLLAVEIAGKKMAQDAINAALDVFWKAVKTALVTVL